MTLAELRRNAGVRGTRKLIAYRDTVYDVTACPRWHPELHEQLHCAGQDPTSALPDGPHGEKVLPAPLLRRWEGWNFRHAKGGVAPYKIAGDRSSKAPLRVLLWMYN
jgi:predicted heme/steroid binding protein